MISTKVLNEQTVRESYSHDPEFDTLLRLACVGPEPVTHADFVCNDARAGRMRDGPVRTPTAIWMHALDVHAEGKGLLLRRAALRAVVDQDVRVHVSEVFLTEKPGKPLGRWIFDFSNSPCGSSPNHPDLRAVWAEVMGAIEHPTLSDLVRVTVNAERETGPGQAWGGEQDISKAFLRLRESPNGAALHAVCVRAGPTFDEDVILVPLVQFFGSQGAPYCWQVVNRALMRRCAGRLTPSAPPTSVMYADDKYTAGAETSAAAEMEAFEADARDLLGPDAMSDDKCALSRSPTMIGWMLVNVDRVVLPLPARGVQAIYHVFHHDK